MIETPLLPAHTGERFTFAGQPRRNRVWCMDWNALVSQLPDQSVDAYILDLPYGSTACHWDEIIPFAPMWEQVKRTLKPRGVFVTTASQPFTSKLVMSNVKWFRCEWIWRKPQGTGYLNANRQPMKNHENVIVFAEGEHDYNPQMRDGKPYRATSGAVGGFIRDKTVGGYLTISDGERYPLTVLDFNSETGLHPTQKPLDLMEYLIRTYTQPGDLVVDFCAGSGTTALAARNTGRDYIIGDSSEHYCNVARERLRTSILEPHYVKTDDDVTTLPVKEGYEAHLFAQAASE